MHGLLAFADGRFADAARLLRPLRGAAGARLGGSHAQRDVIDQTLLAAAARGGGARGGPGAARGAGAHPGAHAAHGLVDARRSTARRRRAVDAPAGMPAR